MRLKQREGTNRDQGEVGSWMQPWSKRREGSRLRPWQAARAAVTTPQGTSGPTTITTDSVSEGLMSGSLGPGDVVVKVPSADPLQLLHEKPWYSLHGISTYFARQREKIPRRFRKSRVEVEVEGKHRRREPTSAPSSSTLQRIGDDQPMTNEQDVIAIETLYDDTLEPGSISPMLHSPGQDSKAPPLGSHGERPTTNGESRRGTAFMAGSSLKKEGIPAGHSLAEDHQDVALGIAGEERKVQSDSQTQRVSGQETAHERLRDPAYSTSTSSGPDGTSHDYQPRPQTKDWADSAEFVSSAVMVRCPTGEPDSVKLFYDTMSTDNIASRDFVDKYGFQERPIFPDDLKVYDTPSGVPFAPTHYVEIELKDTVRGIKDYTKASFNVAGSMGGVGLLAGRRFMIEHRIALNAKEGPGAYVLTSKKPSEDAKRAQKLLLDKTATAMEKANMYAGSSSGSTTTPTGTSQAQHLAASSHTSTSSSAKKDTSSGK